jgi:hypothetical protein
VARCAVAAASRALERSNPSSRLPGSARLTCLPLAPNERKFIRRPNLAQLLSGRVKPRIRLRGQSALISSLDEPQDRVRRLSRSQGPHPTPGDNAGSGLASSRKAEGLGPDAEWKISAPFRHGSRRRRPRILLFSDRRGLTATWKIGGYLGDNPSLLKALPADIAIPFRSITRRPLALFLRFLPKIHAARADRCESGSFWSMQ